MNDKEKFIAELYPAAHQVARETGMSWELILAQAAQETGWGEKVLPGSNNIFNIKDSAGWEGATKTYHVWEVDPHGNKVWQDDKFRVYDNYEEALRDRVKFLQENSRYAKAGLFEEGVKGNLEAEAKALQKAGYATDPHYAEQLVQVFNGRTMRHAIAYGQALERGDPLPDLGAVKSPGASIDSMSDGVLKQKEHGYAVKAMQEKLVGLGYFGTDGKPLVADADFGPSTKHAVEQFQRDHGLTVDGKAGPKTLEALAQAKAQEVEKPRVEKPSAPSMTNVNNPDHGRYSDVVGKLETLEQQRAQAGLPALFGDRQQLENAAGQVVFESKVSGLKQVDNIVARPDGQGIFAVQGQLSDPSSQRVYLDRAQAISQDVPSSTRQVEALAQMQGQAQTGVQAQAQPTR